MRFKFSDVEDAFFYVSSAPMMTNSALLCKETGEIFYHSDYLFDGEGEAWEEASYRDDCVPVPHKNELDLGRDLVFEFVRENIPEDTERVRNIFRRKGAHGRYKELLAERDLLEKWYDFENTRQAEALREWCEYEGLELID